jgi:transcriptional regulator with XRE-family HTH domain
VANFLYIKDLAGKRGITLSELAKRGGITYSALNALIKNGSTNTTTIESIANALDVPVGYFFDDGQNINLITQSGDVNGRDGVCGHSVNLTDKDTDAKEDMSNKDKEIEYLKELLAEKERLIQVLMKKGK